MSRRQRRERRTRRKRHTEPRALRTRHSLITGATVTAGVLVGFTATAAADTFEVDNLSDNGALDACTSAPDDCSLRGAVSYADNLVSPYDNITFQSGLSGQITLTGGELNVTGPTYFLGPGADVLRISGNSSSRIFNINQGTPGGRVGIYDLSLMYGHTAGKGGAVYNLDGVIKVVRSVISKNSSDLSGGGIADQGLYNYGYGTYIVDSTVTGNSAAVAGGGVYGHSSLGTIENSTISGNHQTSSSSPFGGGGVFSYYYTTSINDSTIAGNTAARTGGGVLLGQPVSMSGHRDELNNTIVADNSAVVANPDLGGNFTAGFSLIENPAGASISSSVAGSNITGVDPQLNGLSDNGGPTPTQMPAVTSPAIDQGKRALRGSDQRALGRPFEVPTIPNSAAAGADGSDIGAVELQASELPPSTFSAKAKGTTLVVSVSAAGSVSVADAKAPLAASAAKKKRKLLLNASSGSGGPPTISVQLRLTKLAKQKRGKKGKVTVNARITFTPNRGIPKTVTQKLQVKSKK